MTLRMISKIRIAELGKSLLSEKNVIYIIENTF
jgi:hypothetical protein